MVKYITTENPQGKLSEMLGMSLGEGIGNGLVDSEGIVMLYTHTCDRSRSIAVKCEGCTIDVGNDGHEVCK